MMQIGRDPTFTGIPEPGWGMPLRAEEDMSPSCEPLGDLLTRRCVYWQTLLRLQDWRIELKLVDWHEVGPNQDAVVDYSRHHQEALIRMVAPSQHQAGAFGRQAHYDAEFLLLHELLHLSLVGWDVKETDTGDVQQERAINHLAGALLELERGGKHG